MCWVGDVAHALVVATEKAAQDIVFPEAVEVGPKHNKTVQEVAHLIIHLTGSSSKVVNLPMRPGEIPGATVSADINTLKHVDMTEASLMPVDKGMQITIDWVKELLNENKKA